MATVTHRIDDELKAELEAFCEAHGLEEQAVIEEAIASWLDDARDVELVEERRKGAFVMWRDVRDEP